MEAELASFQFDEDSVDDVSDSFIAQLEADLDAHDKSAGGAKKERPSTARRTSPSLPVRVYLG